MFHESSLTNRDFLDPRRLTTEHIVTLDDLLDMGFFHERNHLPVGSILEDVGLGVRREGECSEEEEEEQEEERLSILIVLSAVAINIIIIICETVIYC